MAKGKKSVFFCQNCGHEEAKWLGQCPGCGEWNTFVEEKIGSGVTKGSTQGAKAVRELVREAKVIPLNDVTAEDDVRCATGIKELDRVLGGGIVPGSLVLVGGDPGIGKSTLLLQVCSILADKKKVLYISGEESQTQIKLRANRMGNFADGLFLLCETNLEIIRGILEKERPEPDPRGQTGKAEDGVSVAAGETEYRAPRASEEHQCAHGGYHAEDKTDDGCGTPARFEFPRGDGGGQRAEHQPHDFRAQVLDDGRAVQAKPSGHIALEARYADPHVCRVAELLQPYGDQADDGAHNDDARRCRKKIFPHLLLLPKRFGGYTMRTMAPS